MRFFPTKNRPYNISKIAYIVRADFRGATLLFLRLLNPKTHTGSMPFGRFRFFLWLRRKPSFH